MGAIKRRFARCYFMFHSLDANEELAQLRAQNAQLCAQNAQLCAQNAQLCAQNAQLCAQNAQLCAQNAALQAQNAALRLSNARLHRLLKSESLGVLIGSSLGQVLQMNRSLERILGRSSTQLNLAQWQEYVPREELALHQEKAESLRASGVCPAWETAFLRPDGSRVPFVSGATLMDSAPENASIGANPTLLMWAIDISERKHIETELRASEERMRAIVENLHDGLLITDKDNNITYANRRMSEITGFSAAELVGHNAHRLLTAPELWADCEQRDRERMQGESGTYEIPIRHKDGSTRWMLINGSPLRDATGAIVGTIGAHFDITERKHDENERARFAAKLENSNRDLETFAFAVSHDLKAPLRKIEIFGARLHEVDGAHLSPDGQLYLGRMRHAARRMTGLINGLLAYSRVATTESPRRQVNLNQIVRDVMIDLELAVESAGARIEIGDLPTVRADATQMHQLLQNLIGNALTYRRPDVPLVVRVRGRIEAGRCEIEVADNGRGFAPQQAETIFEIFRRLDNDSNDHDKDQDQDATEATGTGIGLSICRAIAQRHGGTLIAWGTPQKGAVFCVQFPLDVGAEVPGAGAPETEIRRDSIAD